MHLLEGEVSLTAGGGPPRTCRAGDSFFVPKGCVVDRVGTMDLRKVYCPVVPRAMP